ncbi:MAG: UDP-2,3-diacylglucosamine diphosphatase LpxI [Pseudomonadota bacterium]
MDLAIIAGQGGLPPHLVRVLLARGEVPLICEIDQFPSEIEGELPRLGFRLETSGTFLNELKSRGVKRVCMAGAVRRPNVDPSLIDAATIPLVPTVMAALSKGDDGTLRIMVNIFESRGIEVIGASDLDPDLLPIAGAFSKAHPPESVSNDIIVAQNALEHMGAKDLGQAVVVRDGQIVAREADSGTDAMLRDLNSPAGLSIDPIDIAGQALDSAADWLSGPATENVRKDVDAGAVLYKAPKPGQELRVDMPVIGPDTVTLAAQARLSGIVIAADGVMVLERDEVRKRLEQHGLFLWVHTKEAS